MSSAKPMSSISSASSSTTVASAPRSQRAPGDVVQRPARGGDDDVHAALQRAQLPADRLPAVDRQHPGAEVLAVAVERLGDLHRQLAGGHQHQRHRVAAAAVAGSRCSSGSANAAVLPVPVAAWPEQVPTLQQRRDRLPLDRRRLLVAEGGERAQQLGAQPEIGEGGSPSSSASGAGSVGVVLCRCGTHAPSFSSPPSAPLRRPAQPCRSAQRRRTRSGHGVQGRAPR